jgi:hypothetical protein
MSKDEAVPYVPNGVTVTTPEGEVYPLDDTLLFRGLTKDGLLGWVVFGPADLRWARRAPTMSIEWLPPKASISIPIADLASGYHRFIQADEYKASQ